MAKRIPATRLSLLGIRRRMERGAAGVSLLKDKREALMRTFMGHLSERVRYHELMENKSREAVVPLVEAYSHEGVGGVSSYGYAAKRELGLDMKVEKVWGISVATFEAAPIKRGNWERGFDPSGAGPGVSEAAAKFEDLLALILDTATSEIRIKKLGAEIKKTSRRINALEVLLLPAWEKSAKKISNSLEEAERDEHQRIRLMLRRREKVKGRV